MTTTITRTYFVIGPKQNSDLFSSICGICCMRYCQLCAILPGKVYIPNQKKPQYSRLANILFNFKSLGRNSRNNIQRTLALKERFYFAACELEKNRR